MRLLLALAILAGGMLASSPTADAGRRYMRATKLPCYAAQRPRAWRAAPPCRRAWQYRPPDSDGFGGFPRWARDAFTVLRN